MTQDKLRFRARLHGTKTIIKAEGKVVSSDDSAIGSNISTLETWAKGKFERLAEEDLRTASVDIYEITETVVKTIVPLSPPSTTPRPALPTATGPCGVCGAHNCKRHTPGYQLGKPGL